MTSALRKKLLSLAIRGKLVPQDAADEPASILLERIRAERESKENAAPRRGRGRRSSSDNPPCPKMGTSPGAAAVAAAPAGVKGSVFEPSFPIPESWAWTRLGTILKVPPRNGYSPKPVANKTKTKRLTLTATTSGIFKPEEFKYVADEIPFDSYLWLKPGDLLVQRSNSIEHIGTSCIFTGKPHEYIYPDLMMKLVLAESLDVEFFDLVLKSDNSLHYFQRNATGSAGSMPKINKEILENTPIPLPPISEQHAIVARFKKLSSLCERIDTAAEEMNAISRHAKSRILDLAIRGDLMPQDPTDEPASVLLDRIRSTADKPPCPKRTNETIEPPFPIPESWRWTTLGSVCELIAGVSYEKRDVVSSGIRILRGGNLDEEHRISFYDDDVFLPMQYIDKTKTVEKGDVVLVASTGSASVIGRAAIAPISMTNVQIGAFLRIARSRMPELSEWIQILLTGERFRDHIRQSAKGTNIKNLKSNHFSLFLVPIPPLAEQRRIVAKVEELFSAIDAMATK